MTTRQLVSELSSKGYSVKYRIRRDGGILITSIDGQKFKGGAGNMFARTILNVQLSQRRSQQLTKITKERVLHPRKIPIETPADLERYRKRVMRKWRKAGLTGSISKKNLRRIIEDRGFEGAKTYLEEMERHTQGKAYYGQINALLSRIAEDIGLIQDEIEIGYIKRAFDLIDENRDELKPEWVFKIFDELYKWEKAQITASAFYLFVKDILS